MGRGRQKAKQTKVARKLKYESPSTDYRALERELSSSGGSNGVHPAPADDVEDVEDVDDWSEPSRR